MAQAQENLLVGETFYLKSSYMEKLNKIMPPGMILRSVKRKSPSKTPKAPSKRPRKRYRTQKACIKLQKHSEWIDKNWGLQAGGEAARRCYQVLKNLKNHTLSGPFLQAVDPVAFNLPDYLEIIQDPVDLSLVERNLKLGIYQNSQEFAIDVRRIWLNAFTYNATNTEMFYITLELATYFERQFKELENLLFVPGEELQPMDRNKKDLDRYFSKPMSLQEKKLLASSLNKLNSSQLTTAYKVVIGKSGVPKSFQLNLNKLSTEILRKLEKYVKLQHQASMHGSRQRLVSPLKRCPSLPNKRQRNFYEEMEYY